MSRMFICGDTHGGQAGGLRKLSNKVFKERLTNDDYMFQAGDFGLVWDLVPQPEEKYHTKWLAAKPYTFLFVDGNHENFDRLERLPEIEMFGGKVGVLVENKIFHLKRGEVYIIDGKKFFVFGGGTSIDKASRREGISWWPQEEPNYREYKNGLDNLDKHDWKVDIVITHDCPASIYNNFNFEKYLNGTSQLQNFLEEVKTNLSFKKWYFGHYHWDVELDDKFTILYNHVKEMFQNEFANDSNS